GRLPPMARGRKPTELAASRWLKALVGRGGHRALLKNRVEYPISPNGAASRAIFVTAEAETRAAETRSIDKGIPSRAEIRSEGALTVRATMAAAISCLSLLVAAGKNPRMVSAKPTLPPTIKPLAVAPMVLNDPDGGPSLMPGLATALDEAAS